MGRIEIESALKGQSCPGEDVCLESPGHPLFENDVADHSVPIEDVCGACKFRETKPGNEPEEIKKWIPFTLDLDLAQQLGGTFEYPNGLEVRDWVCLKALESARSSARMKENWKREKAARDGAEQNRLEQLSKRGLK